MYNVFECVNGLLMVRFNILIILVRRKVVMRNIVDSLLSDSLFSVDAFRIRKECGTRDKSFMIISCGGGGVLCLTLAAGWYGCFTPWYSICSVG